jgi:large subunit ribosomal protein L17
MRHLNAGYKLGRNTSHRRALMRNLVTSLVLEERIKTTVQKAKAIRPWAEHMITLGKRGTDHAKRQASAWLLDKEAVGKLFDKLAPRFGDRPGGYTRIIKAGVRAGDNAEVAYIEYLGSEAVQQEKKERRAKLAEKRAEAAKQAAEAEAPPPETGGEEKS